MLLNQINVSLFFLYFFIQVFIAPKNDYSLISTINTLLTCVIPNYLLLSDYNVLTNIFKYNIDEISSLYEYPSKFLVSYVVFDIYYSLFPFKKDMLLHGILLLCSILLIETYNIQHLICPALLMQTSTLFLNFMKTSDLCGLLFILTFFVYRILAFPVISYKYLFNKYDIIVNNEYNIHKVISLLVISINLLNLYWFKKIVLIFKYKLKKKFNKIE